MSSGTKKFTFYEILDQYAASIQHEVRMNVNKQSITVVKFLRKREYEFYVYVLPLFQEHKFPMQTFLYKEDQIAKFVYMIVEGKALNMTTCKLMSEGIIISYFII
jgi:hypothetical protein